jgi:hypothetical protein
MFLGSLKRGGPKESELAARALGAPTRLPHLHRRTSLLFPQLVISPGRVLEGFSVVYSHWYLAEHTPFHAYFPRKLPCKQNDAATPIKSAWLHRLRIYPQACIGSRLITVIPK